VLTAPPPHARLNWNHPLARGLFLVVAGGVQFTQNAITSNTGVKFKAGGLPGGGLAGTATSTDLTVPGFGTSNERWTMHALYTRGTTVDPMLFSMYEASSGAGINDRSLGLLTTTGVPFAYLYDGGLQTLSGSGGIGLGQTASLTATANTGLSLYQDGKQYSLAVANNGFGYTTPVLSIGRGNNAGNTVNAAMDGVLHAGYVWKDRALTSSEAESLYLDPFQFFDTSNTIRYWKIGKSLPPTSPVGNATVGVTANNLSETTRVLSVAFNP
jgi:hypothetical protein